MTWAIMIINLIGTWLNCRKRVAGFYIWLLCNIAWLIYDVATDNYARCVLDVVQAGFCMYGIMKWSRNCEKSVEKK